MFKRLFFFFASCFLFFFLSSCQSPTFDHGNKNVQDARYKMAEAQAQFKAKVNPAPLVVHSGYYVDTNPVDLEKQPRWLSNRIIIRGEQLPFSYYSRIVGGAAGRNILLTYQEGLDDKVTFSMNYSGTVKGALDILVAKTGYAYTVSKNKIYWQSVVTKTFDIAFMPGDADYQVGKTSGGGGTASAAASTSSGSGSTSSTTVSAVLDDTASSQYSSLKGSLSVWKDLESSITQMLSPVGKMVVSQSTTSVTVSDHPSNIELVGKYIENLNHELSKQVLVKVQIITVTLEKNFNFGINWNIVQSALSHGYYKLVSSNGTPLTLTSLVNLSNSHISAGIDNATLFQGSESSSTNTGTGVLALIDALQTQGKVSVITQPQVLCQNNQVSSIRILDQQGYLASVEQTSTGTTSSGSASVTSAITPGNIQSGLTLYVLPKILNNKVYMQVYADLSNNLGTTNVSSQSNANSSNAVQIQVPHVTQQQFNERSFVKSGDTLILSGYRQLANRIGTAQLFNSQDLGGKTAQQQNVETIVLITPIILRGIG